MPSDFRPVTQGQADEIAQRRLISGASQDLVPVDIIAGSAAGPIVTSGGPAPSAGGGLEPTRTPLHVLVTSGSVVGGGGTGSTSVSGQPVGVSGATVIAKVSGETVVAKVSGETVVVGSGLPVVASVSGQDVNVAIWNAAFNTATDVRGGGVDAEAAGLVGLEGNARLYALGSGAYDRLRTMTGISGAVWSGFPLGVLAVGFVSGANAVQVSGAAVQVSGATVNAKVSGETVRIVYVPTATIADATQSNRLQSMTDNAGNESIQAVGPVIFDGTNFNRIRSWSGAQQAGTGWVGLLAVGVVSGANIVRVSGETVIAKVSGETVVAKVSGETVVASVSGNYVYLAASGGPGITAGSGSLQSGAVPLHVLVISGSVVGGGGTSTTNISGQAVTTLVSGQPVGVSGATVVISVSGNYVYLAASGGPGITAGSGSLQSGAVPLHVLVISGSVAGTGGGTTSGTAVLANVSGASINVVSGAVDVTDRGTRRVGQVTQIDNTGNVIVRQFGTTLDNQPGATVHDVAAMPYLFASGFDRWRTTWGTGSGALNVGPQGVGAVGLVSGWNAVWVSGQVVLAKVSGETVIAQVSGATLVVSVSGQTVVASVSGQTVVAAISGATIVVSTSGQVEVVADISGNRITSTSGAGVLSGLGRQAIDVNLIKAPVSGETVIAKVSGETLAVSISGQTVVAGISGQTLVVSVSGQTVVAQVSGGTLVVSISGQIVAPIDVSGVRYTTTSGAGVLSGLARQAIDVNLIRAPISGETVIAKVSGETLVVSVSGQTLLAKVSGETLVVSVSGQVLYIAASGGPIVTAGSGSLQSGAVPLHVLVISGSVVGGGGTSTTNISGQAVTTLVSGQPIVLAVSGPRYPSAGSGMDPSTYPLHVLVVSGSLLAGGASVSVSSGLAVLISGQVVVAQNSGQTVVAQVSGQTLVVSVSGQTIVAAVSGATVIASTSGQVEVMADASGKLITSTSGAGVLSGVARQALDVSPLSGASVNAIIQSSQIMVPVDIQNLQSGVIFPTLPTRYIGMSQSGGGASVSGSFSPNSSGDDGIWSLSGITSSGAFRAASGQRIPIRVDPVGRLITRGDRVHTIDSGLGNARVYQGLAAGSASGFTMIAAPNSGNYLRVKSLSDSLLSSGIAAEVSYRFGSGGSPFFKHKHLYNPVSGVWEVTDEWQMPPGAPPIQGPPNPAPGAFMISYIPLNSFGAISGVGVDRSGVAFTAFIEEVGSGDIY